MSDGRTRRKEAMRVPLPAINRASLVHRLVLLTAVVGCSGNEALPTAASQIAHPQLPVDEDVASPQLAAVSDVEDCYAIWSLVMDRDATEMIQFSSVKPTLHLYRPCTVVLDVQDAYWSNEWEQCLWNMRPDTRAAFMKAACVVQQLDPSRIHLGLPFRSATPDEMDGFLGLTSSAESGASGLTSVSGIGFSEDRNQAMVLVTTRRVDSDNVFMNIWLLKRSSNGWSITSGEYNRRWPLDYSRSCGE